MKNEFQYAVFTDKGDRAVNEDSAGVFSSTLGTCFVLCDGLGGHGMGDVASSLVVAVFGDQFSKTDECVNFLGQAFAASQDVLMAEQIRRNAKTKMKTTCVSVVMDDKYAYIAHIGDSRAYIFRKNKVVSRTLDHSIPQMLALSREIKEDQIRHHPDRNIVLRVMGVDWDEPMYELMVPISLRKCDAFLLCSDGFWELIDEKEMCAHLKTAKTANEWLGKMTETIKRNGEGTNMDNYSAIAVIRQ